MCNDVKVSQKQEFVENKSETCALLLRIARISMRISKRDERKDNCSYVPNSQQCPPELEIQTSPLFCACSDAELFLWIALCKATNAIACSPIFRIGVPGLNMKHT